MVHEQLARLYQGFRRDSHPMAVMVGVVGALSAFYHDSLDINNPEHREISAFRLIAGAAELSTYRFGTRRAQHHFCRRCGVGSFYVPRSHPDGVDVNARCLDGVDAASLPRSPFDGRYWEEAVGELRSRLREGE
jgi:hypothetical protein